ncbi:hypothetical protein FPZ24_10750 [Sphingomonas panacisoli]|uniref:FecR protein domain-containing protein n=1 Tax=Sphingomonas panacisoli TaxID=1813879 RepID=A0A5B8LJH1_9SPHN|nr:FecR domain-containing protein [Sphingomonas panacisoli]QDZ07905.1 hypothetical protein FPZ24_10750 [Sphingomonas panacisoli]
MNEEPDDIDEAAARWHAAQHDDAMDWDGFTRWLEEDPRHRTAYDAIALLDARIDAALPILRRPQSVEIQSARPRWRRSARWATAGSAVAAAAVAGLFFLSNGSTPPLTVYRTAQGQGRDVQLADGSSAAMAPGSVLRIPAKTGDPIAMEGNATFDIRHDPTRSVEIRAGGYAIRDIGTRFDVSTSGGMLRVAVTQGRVAVRSLTAGGEVEVSAGNVLTAVDPQSAPTLAPLGARPSSGWRNGRMTYDDVPLGLVVADIARFTGSPVTIDPAIAKRRFSGVLATGSGDAMTNALAELANLRKRTERDAIRLDGGAGR